MTLIKSISGIRGTIGGKPGNTLNPLDIVKFTTVFMPHSYVVADVLPTAGLLSAAMHAFLARWFAVWCVER